MKIFSAIDILRQKTIRLGLKNTDEALFKGDMIIIKNKENIAAQVINPPREIPSGAHDSEHTFISKMTPKEIREFELAQADEESRLEKITQLAKKQNLAMKFFLSRVGFEGTVISFFFASPDQIDFRELLRDASRIFNAKLYLHRCGPRDRAKLMGGYGICGRGDDCCIYNNFSPENVPMNAVRDQGLRIKSNSSLFDPSGKIKKCMMHEVDMYRTMRKYLPHIQQKVKIGDKEAKVIGLDTLNLKIKVEFDNGTIEFIPVAEVQYTGKVEAPPEKPIEIILPEVDITNPEIPDGPLSVKFKKPLNLKR